MGKVARWSHWFRNRSEQRHFSHRYVCAIESLVDEDVFNDAVTSPAQSARPRPKLVIVSSRGPNLKTGATRAEVA